MRPHRIDPDCELERELLRLTRGNGGLRLAIADGVERLVALGGIEALGFPTVEAYARERLGRSGRWVGDARTLNRRLARWSGLREAFLSGRLSASKVELLARHLSGTGSMEVTPEQIDGLIAWAEAMTVRALRAGLGVAEDEPRAVWATITRRVERVDALAFEGAILLMKALGEATRTAAVEGMLAEGLVTLLNRAELDASLVARIAGPEPGAQNVAAGHTDIGPPPQRSATIPVSTPADAQAAASSNEAESVDEVASLDRALRHLATELARRDLRIGELALALGPARGTDDFFRDTLGLSPSSMAARLALARRVERLPKLRAAIEAGALGFESATLLARVASPETEGDWLDLAIISTTKIFREHVDAAELHARAEDRPLRGLRPPSSAELDAAHGLERQVLETVFDEADTGSPMSVSASSEVETDHPDQPDHPGSGTIDLRLTLPGDLAGFWSDLEVLHADAGFPADSFVAFLARVTLDTWRAHARLPAYGDIYLRDRYRCQNPVCRSRQVTPHHIVFRSRGGGDEPSNLISLCARCHLDLVHGGHLRVSGLAPDGLRWESRANGA
ncbi:MAG TPA: HNH endonuclease [Myxococcota bacterium]|nr:HNH endonuclease [Myxococcota bacterium]